MSPDKKLKSSPQHFMLIFNYEAWLVKLGLEPAFSSISRTTLCVGIPKLVCLPLNSQWSMLCMPQRTVCIAAILSRAC